MLAIAARRRKASSPVCGIEGAEGRLMLSPGISSSSSAGADCAREEGGIVVGDTMEGGMSEADGENVWARGVNAGAGETSTADDGAKVGAGAGAGAVSAAGRIPIDMARRRWYASSPVRLTSTAAGAVTETGGAPLPKPRG